MPKRKTLAQQIAALKPGRQTIEAERDELPRIKDGAVTATEACKRAGQLGQMVRRSRFIHIAITFTAIGFMFGACANQLKTFANAYNYQLMQACTFGP